MQDLKAFLLAMMILCAVALKSGTAAADALEIIDDTEYYFGYTLYEHPTCRIKYVVVGPDNDEMYIEDELVATFDLTKTSINEIAASLDQILREHRLPGYNDLATVHCT